MPHPGPQIPPDSDEDAMHGFAGCDFGKGWPPGDHTKKHLSWAGVVAPLAMVRGASCPHAGCHASSGGPGTAVNCFKGRAWDPEKIGLCKDSGGQRPFPARGRLWCWVRRGCLLWVINASLLPVDVPGEGEWTSWRQSSTLLIHRLSIKPRLKVTVQLSAPNRKAIPAPGTCCGDCWGCSRPAH